MQARARVGRECRIDPALALGDVRLEGGFAVRGRKSEFVVELADVARDVGPNEYAGPVLSTGQGSLIEFHPNLGVQVGISRCTQSRDRCVAGRRCRLGTEVGRIDRKRPRSLEAGRDPFPARVSGSPAVADSPVEAVLAVDGPAHRRIGSGRRQRGAA